MTNTARHGATPIMQLDGSTGQRGWGKWLAGARPRTIPAGVVPVVVGTACAARNGEWHPWLAALCLVVAVALQVGVNYANDYSDGVKGTDSASRVGPTRLVGSGSATPRAVKAAAAIAFLVACIAGMALSLATYPWLLMIGALAVIAAVTYTAGPKPYGYYGLGELMVFVFFGLVATCGTAFVQSGSLSTVTNLAAVAMGAFGVAMLVVNNLRDIRSDASSDKRTLAVRMGDESTRWLYIATLVVPFLVIFPLALMEQWVLLCLVLLVPLFFVFRKVVSGASGAELVSVLANTGKLQVAYGALLSAALVLG